jgi:hypothetical protein
MHLQRILICLIAVLGVGTAFLPWKMESLLGETTVTTGTDTAIILNSMQLGDGWLVLAIFLIVLLLAVAGKRRAAMSWVKTFATAFLAIGIAAVAVYDIVALKKLSVNLPGSSLNTEVVAGYGLYATAGIASLLTLLAFAGRRMGTGRLSNQ